MIDDLPKPISDYVQANARLDLDGMLRPFAPDAVVRDDGGRDVGTEALRRWIQDATIASAAIFTPDTVRHQDGLVVLEGPTHGNFAGSPLRFTLRFGIDDEHIRSLDVSL